MEKSLRDLKLTSDELTKLEKAFKDPEFCKLFAEYAEELNDPENKRRFVAGFVHLQTARFGLYEEEIKLAEMERGVDVEFIKPIPFCVLKSRNWPSLRSGLAGANQFHKEALGMVEGQKVFINICSSEKLGMPEIIPGGDGRSPSWSIPHSFSPPVEDLDKENKLCLVKQAKTVWSTSHSGEKAILASVHLLKGLTHKGTLRATVIRRKRADFKQCQERLAEAEKAAFAEARNGPNPKETLAALSKYKRYLDENMGTIEKMAKDEEAALPSKYKKPEVMITHSSEFDMLDYTNDCCHSIRSTRPTAIKVEITLPGIESAACLDLDITEKKLHLQVG
ncbi:unnamed protein product [Hydatigera taeniaeformis]|uniref:PIH1 domain-containing protein n=1 Tax=Hydatigena taeniaeformis TaxID=6205 RepID=A0A0R3WQU1_HYDTA|nr:unnamed protein product [Hydatigera taeniaeformis]